MSAGRCNAVQTYFPLPICRNAHSMEMQNKALTVKTCKEYCCCCNGRQRTKSNSRPQKAQALSACMAMLFTMDTFLSFHILSTTRGCGTRNKHGGIAQKIRRRGEQEAAMILQPLLPLVVSKEGTRGGITSGEPGCNIYG